MCPYLCRNVKDKFYYSISKFPPIIAFIDEQVGSQPLIIAYWAGSKMTEQLKILASHIFH